MSMLDRNVFKETLRQELQSHLTLSHPIFEPLFDTRNPDLDLMRKVALQGYQLTKHFLYYVEHLFFHCPLPAHKTVLLYNLFEEETGRLSRTDNHVTLMQNFIKSLGISDAERDAAQALPATRELIEYRVAAVRDTANYHIGAAAVLIASEGQNLETSEGMPRHELIQMVYGLTPFDVQFFSVHQKEDVGHVEQGLSLVADYCSTPEMQREALQAVGHTCKLFYAMYENMYREYCCATPAERAALLAF
jgi:pyrroloquinoline-quinone synthase